MASHRHHMVVMSKMRSSNRFLLQKTFQVKESLQKRMPGFSFWVYFSVLGVLLGFLPPRHSLSKVRFFFFSPCRHSLPKVRFFESRVKKGGTLSLLAAPMGGAVLLLPERWWWIPWQGHLIFLLQYPFLHASALICHWLLARLSSRAYHGVTRFSSYASAKPGAFRWSCSCQRKGSWES